MKAESMKRRAVAGLLAAVLAGPFAAPWSRAQELSAADSALLGAYEEGIAVADPSVAVSFLEDAAFAGRLHAAEPQRAADLTAKARGICDLKGLLDRPWRADQEPELSQALALRIDLNTPLTQVGLGPAPEPLLAWMGRYGGYSEDMTGLVTGAIRRLEDVYAVFDYGEAPAKQEWDRYTLRERNALLAYKAHGKLERIINHETRTGEGFQEQVRGDEIFKYLDPAGRARYQRYLTQLSIAESAKSGLSAEQLEGIEGQPIEQQMYLLGSTFDGSEKRPAVSLERKVDGARQSMPGETISYQNNALLTEMLRSAVPGELQGTAAGDKVLALYAPDGRMPLAIESCRGCYAKYEPSTGRIVLDSDMIQQYLRVNNISTEELLLNKEHVDALAKYVSPIIVHEASHHMQHARAEEAGTYKPYVQEDEIEANSMEALYTTEKLRHDAQFRRLFANMRGVSTYADQRLKLAQRFNKNPDDFGEIVRSQYYSGLPSFEASSSQVLSSVSGELERRGTLGPGELDAIESGGVPLQDAMEMTASEITGSVTEIKTEALVKIQTDLMDKAGYDSRYGEAEAWPQSMLLEARRPKAKPRSVPAL